MSIIKCETYRQSQSDAWDKCLGLLHWDDPEGWDGEGGGRGVQDGEHSKTTTPKKKKKNRDITLPTKVRLVKAMVFPVVMYGCES